MTLLVTEIHNHDNPETAAIVFAADRRISVGGKYNATRKKIFEMPRFTAAIGYFGVAEVRGCPMAEWLAVHLRRDRTGCLADFARALATRLNADVPAGQRMSEPSGFHISGFTPERRAEFWFVRNITDVGQPTGLYEAREDFQRRDAFTLQPDRAQIYRNGDLLPHVLLWGVLDDALEPLLGRADFRRVRSVVDYARWVRFKLEVIAYVYKQWSTRPIIGRPIDVIYITPSRVGTV
jgi:hypothetical protein